MEEWRAEEEERKLEKISTMVLLCLDFLFLLLLFGFSIVLGTALLNISTLVEAPTMVMLKWED